MEFFQTLSKPKIGANTFPRPLYHYDPLNGKQYIFIVGSSCIFIYKMKQDKFEIFSKMPESFSPDFHGATIANNDIYIYGGWSKVLAKINIKNKIWTILKHNKTSYDNNHNNIKYNIPAIAFPESFYDEINNDIHMFGMIENYASHYKLNIDNHKFTNLINDNINNNNVEWIKESKMVYIPKWKRLMLFGGIDSLNGNCDNQKIFYCNIGKTIYNQNDNQNQKNYQWHIFKNTLPHKSNTFDLCVCYDHIVIISYYLSNDEIWCLDLLCNQWIKSDIKYPNIYSSGNIIKCNEQIHFFRNNSFHFKIPAIKLCPFILVVSGYLTRIENTFKIFIPLDISILIHKYWNSS